MKTHMIRLCAISLLTVQTLAGAEGTKVTVKKGKVIAETPTRAVAIEAGQRAVLAPDKKPVVTLDDPLVDDLVTMYKWVEAEKQARREPIEGATIFIGRVDSEHLMTFAALLEEPNTTSQPSTVLRLENVSPFEDPRFYDLQGNLLQFDAERINARLANYTLRFPSPVRPGGLYKCIVVSKMKRQLRVTKVGTLWHLRCNLKGPNRLNYCRVILPKSAGFVDSNWPVTMVNSQNDRVAVTCRNFSGPMGNGVFYFAFLWPEKDGTSLADLPRQYRGLRDLWDAEIIKDAERDYAGIRAGGTYEDQTTPLKTLLTLYSAITHKDKGLFLKLIYDEDLRDLAAGQFDSILALAGNLDEGYEPLGAPPWPEDPHDGDTHPFKLCRVGSQLCEATITTVYREKKWYLQGFQPGPQEVDTSGDTSRKTSGGVTITNNRPDLSLVTYEGLEPGAFMKRWLFLGPIQIPWHGEGYFPDDKTAKAFFDQESLPLGQFQPKVTIGDKEYRWALLQSEYGVIDLTGPFQDWYITGYAWARIIMPAETRAVLGIGSDDSVKVWLNGKLVHKHWEKPGRSALPDNDRVGVTFKKGVNHLILKVQNAGGPWGFVCRLLEE